MGWRVASSSASRWRVACDACGAGGWVGLASPGFDVWCESCQAAAHLPGPPAPGERCERCDAPRTAAPRFVELWGELQHLDAVLGAWAAEPAALAAILPERPRLLGDLTPPRALPGDPPDRVELLRALARGDWRSVLAAPPDADARALAARAIARERTGDPAGAAAEWSAVLAQGEDPRARLARGVLHARAGDLESAAGDLERAGDGREARWDRAALLVMHAVARGEGMPGTDVLARARTEAGEASAYWSDPTVGRLLWTLLVERALARGDTPASREPETRATLRAAERELEHATFWDRALVVLGWARLGDGEQLERVAAPLARELAASLLEEPALSGTPLADVAQAVTTARSLADVRDPRAARRALAGPLAREDLRRYRIPCAACARGTVGIAEAADADDADPGCSPTTTDSEAAPEQTTTPGSQHASAG